MKSLKNLLRNKNSSQIVLALILLVFTIFSLYLAFNLKMGLSPDSYYHLELSQVFSETLGIPENTPDTYKWTDITRIPYLSLWINGRILNLNEILFNFNEIFVLRVFNILFSLGTLIFVFLISKRIIKNRWGQILPVFLLSNTLMFVFLSSSINYDNLIVFLCTGAIYFFVRFLQNPQKLNNTILIWLFLLLASLTKSTVLPLAFIIVLIWFLILLKRKVLKKEFFIQFLKPFPLFLLMLFFVLVVLNLNLYAVNIFTYGKIKLSCTDILTHEQCLENGVYYREIYKIPQVSDGGFKETINFVLNRERMGPLLYIPYWATEMSRRVFGIMGDEFLFMDYIYLPFYFFYFLIGLLMIFKNRKKLSLEEKALITVCVFYTLVLLYYHNYKTYIKFNWPDLALQGRYIFLVLGPIYILLSKYFLKIKNRKFLVISLYILIIGFILGSIGWFFLSVPNHWYL